MASDVEVLVVGAGACGMAAAIAAHDGGANVATSRKWSGRGETPRCRPAPVPAAGSKYREAAGIDEQPGGNGRRTAAISWTTPNWWRRMAEVSAATVEWLIDDLGARMKLITAYKHIGHSIQRLHAPVSRRGQDFVDDLLSFVEKRDIPLAVGNGANGIACREWRGSRA